MRLAPDVPTAKAVLRDTCIDTPVIILTADGTAQTTADAMRKGALPVIRKAFDTAELQARIGQALELNRPFDVGRGVPIGDRAAAPPGVSDRSVPWQRQLNG